jgi:hypothetical protein
MKPAPNQPSSRSGSEEYLKERKGHSPQNHNHMLRYIHKALALHDLRKI